MERASKRCDALNLDRRMPTGIQILLHYGEHYHRDYVHGPAIKFAVVDEKSCLGIYPSIAQALGKVDRIKEERREHEAQKQGL